MSDIKLARPIEDYLIGKYDNDTCCYLITKKAYKIWYNHRISVKVTCIKNNSGLSFVEYSLSSNAKFKAWPAHDSSKDIMKMIANESPALHKLLFEVKPAVKSEPAPDDYYIVKYTMPTYYIAKCSEYDGGKSEVPAMFWTSIDNKWQAKVGNKSAAGNPHWTKKFPQLSSEVKAELQKLNPERYKEWEDFYTKKYPNFKPLGNKPLCGCGKCKSCLERLPAPIASDGYVIAGVDGWSLIRVSDFSRSDTPYYHLEQGWKIWPNGLIKGETYRAFMAGQYASQLSGKKLWEPIKEQFEQYYSELERKKAQSEELKYQLNGKNPNHFYFYTVGYGWEAIRKEAIDRYPSNSQEKVMRILIRDGSIRYSRRCEIQNPIITWSQIIGDHPSGKCQSFKSQNEQLFNEWKGSDFDIDQKAMEKEYAQNVLKTDKPIGKIGIFGSSGPDSDKLEGLWDMFTYPKSYKIQAYPGIGKTGMFMPTYIAGFDPYQPDTKTQGVISVWGKDIHGKLVNRLTELESERGYKDFFDYWKDHQAFTPQDYYNMVMNDPNAPGQSSQGFIISKARRVGQSYANMQMQEYQKISQQLNQIKQQFYTPNLKQQNHEINVPRKTITVTVGKRFSSSIISSYQCPPAVTVGHTEHQHQSCRGKEISGGCKIG